ncbi:hypothetical protein MAL1_00222 [Bacteriophage DSS3_MAL1]|nr:hypothetical protein MAL1_00222 [Bacteriophage DSS3_MAL1]
MADLVWKHDPIFDVDKAVTDVGTYMLSRTCMDVSLLFFEGEIIHRCSTGSHAENRKRAEAHYKERAS